MVSKNWFWLAAGIVLFLDQISKSIINYFQPTSAFFHVVHNTGAGFGILQNNTLILAAISLLVALGTILNYRKIPGSFFPQLSWGIFLGGVVGNLIDRALRGYVIDFIDLQIWPVFNIADMAITVSVIGLVYWYWRTEKKE